MVVSPVFKANHGRISSRVWRPAATDTDSCSNLCSMMTESENNYSWSFSRVAAWWPSSWSATPCWGWSATWPLCGPCWTRSWARTPPRQPRGRATEAATSTMWTIDTRPAPPTSVICDTAAADWIIYCEVYCFWITFMFKKYWDFMMN